MQPSKTTPKILLVEDELSWQEIFKEIIVSAIKQLTRDPEDLIQVVGTLEDAKAALKCNSSWLLLIIDIVLDWTMLEYSGITIIEDVQGLKIPIIVISGMAGSQSISTCKGFERVCLILDKADFVEGEQVFISTVRSILGLTDTFQDSG